MAGRSSRLLFFFTIPLLWFSCGIRSGLLVDTTLLLRVFLLTLILLTTIILWVIKKRSLHAGWYEYLFLFWYGWSLLSLLWAISAAEALFWSQLLFLCWLLYLITSSLLRDLTGFETRFVQTLVSFLLFSYILALIKIAMLPYYDPYQVFGISANNNLYAGFLLLSLGFSLRGYTLFRGWWRYLSTATGILSLFFIIILQSRAVYLGTTAAFLLLFLMVGYRFRSAVTRHHLRVAGVSGAVLTACVFSFYTSLDTTRQYYFLSKLPVWNYFITYDEETLQRLEEERLKTDSLTGMPLFDHAASYYENANLRVIFWSKSLSLTLRHPLHGVGAGNWRLAVPSVREPANPDHTLRNHTYSQPHNEAIGILAELGIVGFIPALLVLLFPPLLTLFRILRARPPIPRSTVFYTAFILGFYLYALFDFPLHRVEHLILLITALAILRYDNTAPDKARINPPVMPRFVSMGVIPMVLLFTLVVTAARIRGEYHTRDIFHAERRQDVSVITASGEAENIFYTITPNTLPISWFEGVAWFRLGRYDLALQAFERAKRITPHEVRVLNDYAITLHLTNHTPDAIDLLHECLVIDPWFDEARYNLAAIWHEKGWNEKARQVILPCRDSEKKERYLQTLNN